MVSSKPPLRTESSYGFSSIKDVLNFGVTRLKSSAPFQVKKVPTFFPRAPKNQFLYSCCL